MFDNSVILCRKHDINFSETNSCKVSPRSDSNSLNHTRFSIKFDELKITIFYPLLSITR